jgi:biotin carboxyl carrier protein
MDEVKKEQELVKKALAGQLVEKDRAGAQPAAAAPVMPPTQGVPVAGGFSRVFEVTVNGEPFQVVVRGADSAGPTATVVGTTSVVGTTQVVGTPPAAEAATAPGQTAQPAPAPAAAPSAEPTLGIGEQAVVAPMPGMVVEILKQAGEAVKAGDTVCIVEAMKMNNNIETPCDGVIKEFRCKQGDSVAKGEILCTVKKS